MLIKKLTIEGLRGFSEKTEIEFAVPDKVNCGSGLTILVGPNNSGKSTVIEAVHLLNNHNNIIPSAARSIKTNGKIYICVEDPVGNKRLIESRDDNGAFIRKKINDNVVEHWSDKMDAFILSSKRAFSSTFHNNSVRSRRDYFGNISDSDYRNENHLNSNFGGRLLSIYENRSEFDNCLEKVLSPCPKWKIEAQDSNSLYLEFLFDDVKHSSNGAGDGYINIFNIIDALYDSSEDNVILIDEPEISLHPDLQRKLFSLLVEYSKDKQIIVSTHSTYFVDWNVLSENAKIIRLSKKSDLIRCFELKESTKEDVKKLLDDYQKPHILSLHANEIFFLNDFVILTEGQDDVLFYKRIFNYYGYSSKASFFGWGAGGVTKINYVLNILRDLGYEKVFTILDVDQKDNISTLESEYKGYGFFAIDADDVRGHKRDNKFKKFFEKLNESSFDEGEKKEVEKYIYEIFRENKGLIKDLKTGEVEEEYIECVNKLITNMKEYFAEVSVVDSQEEIPSIEIKELTDKSDEIKANNLLRDWLEKNNLYDYAQRQYKEFEFCGGSGGDLSFKSLGNGKFYAILEYSSGLSQNYSITIDFHLIIDVNRNCVYFKKKHIVSNTLPVSSLRKFIEKIQFYKH